jgi:hypothetical protein
MPAVRLRSHARPFAICFLIFVFVLSKPLFVTRRLTDDEVRQRGDALLKQMTLEEKVGQLSQLFVFEPTKDRDEAVSKGQLGSLLFVTDAAEINRCQHLAIEKSRLHIPLIFGFHLIHGFRTIFPVPISLAASWDPGLERFQRAAPFQLHGHSLKAVAKTGT